MGSSIDLDPTSVQDCLPESVLLESGGEGYGGFFRDINQSKFDDYLLLVIHLSKKKSAHSSRVSHVAGLFRIWGRDFRGSELICLGAYLIPL